VEAGDTMTAGELLGALVMLAVIVMPLVSIRIPRVRIPTGLLLIGFAVAWLAVGAWRVATDLSVRWDRLILFSAALIAGGVALFRWGRRTSGG